MGQPKLSYIAETLIGSEIVKLGNMIKERVKQGEKIYNYTIGDFDPKVFPIPSVLEQYIKDAYTNGYTNYPSAEGESFLREAVSGFVKKYANMDYAANEIQIAAGGRPLMYALFQVIVDKGDKVIYAVPSWNNNHYAHLTGAESCIITSKLENDFMPTAAEIAPHISGATLLCLCSPQNPTGTTISKKELSEICDMVVAENAKRGADEKKLYVMFDQMYWTLTYGATEHYSPVALNPAMKEFTIYIDGISKSFCATGVRVGWSLGPAVVIAKMKAILSHLGAWAPMAEQKATGDFLNNTVAVDAFFTAYKGKLWSLLQQLYAGFSTLKAEGFAVDAVAPKAAIYMTIKFDLAGKKTTDGTVLTTQEDVTQYLLANAGLAIVPFYCFGAEKTSPWYRLSIGTCKEHDIKEMFEKLKTALSNLS